MARVLLKSLKLEQSLCFQGGSENMPVSLRSFQPTI